MNTSGDVGGNSEPEWKIAGHGKTDNKPTNKIYLPAHLTEEADIIRPDEEKIYWHYQEVTGVNTIGNQQFEQSKPERKRRGDIEHKFYEYVGNSSVTPLSSEQDSEESGITSLRSTVPKKFFDDFKGNRATQRPVPQKARFRYDTTYYFIYHEDMAQGVVRSCYILAPSELEKVIPKGASVAFKNDTDEKFPGLDGTPKFWS
jgi:hypothetical protein